MSLFGKKKEEAVKSGCCCGASCTPEDMKIAEEMYMVDHRCTVQ